ncbi:hypothetical protein [Mumia sp. DW29H23]|uniref:hypothetical protein n=1 Tax=Mumia sp. DW29H23 TaxID=3421241 RepID=UPI003D69BDA1
MRGQKHLVVLVGALALVATVLGWTASAAPTPKAAPNAPAATTLSKAQVTTLDAKLAAVSRRAKVKPVRTAVNQLSWEGGNVVLTLPLPGERKARARGEARVATKAAACAYGYACLYEKAAYRGGRLSFKTCAFRYLSKYGWVNRTSSWKNNQTKGTYSTLQYWTGKNRAVLNATNAPSSVWYVGGPSDDRADYIRVC